MIKDKKIIVFSGKQFSGKDTVAKILLEKLDGFTRVGIGDAIKIEYGKQKGLTFDEIEANKSQYRPDLIALGNEGRAKSPTFWLQKIIDLDYDVMVPDMRVMDEYNILKESGALMIRVNASKETRAARGELSLDDDPTETALDGITDWDFVITNESTYDELKEKAYAMCDEIKNRIYNS